MNNRTQNWTRLRVWAVLSLVFLLSFLFIVERVSATNGQQPSVNERLVTIYDQGTERTIITKASTVKEALLQAHIKLETADAVEPATTEQLIAKSYRVNVYRARPVLIIDGEKRQSIMTAEQSPRRIVESIPGQKLYDEDKVSFAQVNSVIAEGGAGLKLRIDRATVFQFTLYGKAFEARTQATTVGDMLNEKGVHPSSVDGVSVPLNTPLVAGMNISVWRNGKQTITQEEVIPMPTEQVKDVAREIGFKEVKNIGTVGKKQVTYQIEMRNGVEIARSIITSVTTLEPIAEVVVIGAKLPVPTSPSEAAVLGHQMMLSAGYNEDQWPCLYNLWQRESRWTVTAGNRSSGAYGIPQSLPASKMASVASDYLNNAATQITWGLGYIKDRYQTPCGAWSFYQNHNWY